MRQRMRALIFRLRSEYYHARMERLARQHERRVNAILDRYMKNQ